MNALVVFVERAFRKMVINVSLMFNNFVLMM